MISILLVLALVISAVFPWRQPGVMAESGREASGQIFAFDDAKFYDALKKGLSSFLNNNGAILAYDDEKTTLTLDMEKVRVVQIKGVDMTNGNSPDILKTLLQGAGRLSNFGLEDCKLGGFDLSVLDNKANLEYLYLLETGIQKMPDLTLRNLTYLNLSENDFSAQGACANITKEKLPSLTSLYLDNCRLSDIDFIKNAGKLKTLSLGDNKLTDDAISLLLDMSGDNLSDLTRLNVGKTVHDMDGSHMINVSSSNRFTDLANLALLSRRFQKLTSVDLTYLNITSLRDFVGVRDGVTFKLQKNKILDFAGLEGNGQFELTDQMYTISGNFAAGYEIEIPELIQRIREEQDVLHGELRYTNCGISDDGTKLVIEPDVSVASLKVTTGKLRESTITLKLKRIPHFTVPQNLTAEVGDRLADVSLPQGFTWMAPDLTLKTAGIHTYKAVYTPSNLEWYVVVDNIDIPVNVKSDVPEPAPTGEPTPVPVTPAPTPEAPIPPQIPTSTPEAPTPVPVVPTSTPEVPTPAPQIPTSTPEVPTPTPVVPTSAPEVPTPTPEAPIPSQPPSTPDVPVPTPYGTKTPMPVQPGPSTPTPKPDESDQDGNQIEKRKDLSLLLAAGKQKGSRDVRLTWRKWNGCSGYEVYCSYCDGKQNYKKLKTVSNKGKRVADHKNLKKNRAYKYYVVTYEIKDGRKHYLAKSPIIHVAMDQEPRTNVKSIKLNKKKVTLKKNQTFLIRATDKKENKKKKLLSHEETFRYYTDDKKVVGLSKKGKIRAKQKGTCTVFVIANNGVASKVKVTVK